MPDLDDFYAYKSTGGGSDNGDRNGNGGCGLTYIVVSFIVFMAMLFIINGSSWDAIDTLLGLGLLVFLFVKFLC